MKILSGHYKGHKLHSFSKSLPLRPMTQIVKKSIFDTIQPYFNEKPSVLDLFSGTGNLSFESLSRGAACSHAVEKNKLCCQVIRKNIEKLNIKDSLILHTKDVFHFLRIRRNIQPFDIIFVDPPFSMKWSNRVIESLTTSFVCNSHSLIILEASSKELLYRNEMISLQLKKNFGDKIVYFFHIIKDDKINLTKKK